MPASPSNEDEVLSKGVSSFKETRVWKETALNNKCHMALCANHDLVRPSGIEVHRLRRIWIHHLQTHSNDARSAFSPCALFLCTYSYRMRPILPRGRNRLCMATLSS